MSLLRGMHACGLHYLRDLPASTQAIQALRPLPILPRHAQRNCGVLMTEFTAAVIQGAGIADGMTIWALFMLLCCAVVCWWGV